MTPRGRPAGEGEARGGVREIVRARSPSQRDLDVQVRAEQICLIYEQAPRAIVISVVVAGIVASILWGVTDRRVLLGWLALVLLLAAGRGVLVASFRRRTPRPNDILLWEELFVWSLVAAGLVWGMGGLLVMPAGSPAHQAAVYFFLIGMAGGASASYSAHTVCTTVTVVSMMVPATAWFLVTGDFVFRAMGVGGILYIATATRATTTLSFFLRRSFQLKHELTRAHEAAQQLARTDELTGLRNRRAFYEAGEHAIETARRYGRPVAVLMLDIDRFKQINDSCGHALGDEALRALADVIRGTVRATDLPGRVGGEEFAILLPETTLEDAASLAERLRVAVAAILLEHEGRPLAFTCSLGVAGGEGEPHSLDALLARADGAMYQAKAEGRNRVVREHPVPAR